MSEHLPHLWDAQYQTDGEMKIRARQKLYEYSVECLMGEPGVDLDLEALQAMVDCGTPPTATLVDLGCSFPHFLKAAQLYGFQGRLIGIEPNTEQFRGLPSNGPMVAPAVEKTAFRRFIETDPADYANIELYQARAEAVPLETGLADVVTAMFMFYHVDKQHQSTTLQEIKRLLKPEEGIFMLATRGWENKSDIRQNETRIAAELTKRLGRTIAPPPPVNAGFTSEDASHLLPQFFCHVYEFRHSSYFVFSDARAEYDLQEAYFSLLDMYTDNDGNSPSEFDFAIALERAIGNELIAVRESRGVITDKLRQSLFVASDRPLQLPAKFSERHSRLKPGVARLVKDAVSKGIGQ